jgi:predicted TIM-barrel fold metal-dependent hydrolase
MDAIPDCPPPRLIAQPPATSLPPGACDSHFHVFGPYARFPLTPARSYTPPEAPLDAYLRMARAIGTTRAVIVQPSVHGSDNRGMLDALAILGRDRARGIAVLDDDADPSLLARLHGQGVRGVRFNSVTGDKEYAGRLQRMAMRIAPLGWHIQLFVDPVELHDNLDVIRALPVDVVIDHLGQIDPAAGLDGTAFRALLAVLDTGKAWVKLTGYRSSHQTAPYADLVPFVRALVATHGDRLVWGSNWPHPIRYHDMPDDAALVDALALWAGDDADLERILVRNPEQLYGFDPESRV